MGAEEKLMNFRKNCRDLIERDAEVFRTTSKAYECRERPKRKKAEKARVMEIVLKDACSVPMESWKML